MISIKDGNFFYQKAKSKEQTYLYNNDISFDLHPGEIMSILGPNGAGKTTLLKCIMGLLKWEKGETLLNGKPLSTLRQKEVWRTIGYVPQASKMTFGYSILDLVTMGRALIARTLVSDPKILILDEPESHLDIQKQKIILQTIKKLVKERDLACIINTHYANHAFYFGDKVLMVAKNKPVITGPVSEIMTEENIFHYFDIEVKKLLHSDNGQVFETIVPKYFGLDNSDR